MQRVLIALLIPVFCAVLTVLPAAARVVAAGEDVRLVLEVAAGENDPVVRDTLLLSGVKYVRSIVDVSALVHAAVRPETRSRIIREGFARWSGVALPCKMCDGSGHVGLGRLCPACHGAGWTGPMRVVEAFPEKCTFCDGTGKTVLGKVCPVCHGAGLTGPAKGKKDLQTFPETCSMCDGTGKDPMGRTCPVCHGAGLTGPAKNRKSSSSIPERCTMCNATGVDFLGRPCPVCHGAGWTGPFKYRPAKILPAWCDVELEKALKTRVLKNRDPEAQELLDEMKSRRRQLLR